ncbi:unnamed protein product, partial [marine sediment metagenome]
ILLLLFIGKPIDAIYKKEMREIQPKSEPSQKVQLIEEKQKEITEKM